jgi:peptide/nickel transport system substrate-binding protein
MAENDLMDKIVSLCKRRGFVFPGSEIYGGKIDEGIIGTPRFINPLLASSDADKDLTALIYSGLTKKDSRGEIVPDLAENYTISPDGLTYTFTLHSDAVFHDGTPVTTDDVLYTITEATDPMIKSPKRVNWEGVLVKKIDERTIRFELKKPFAPFLENTTLGILPSHIWKNVPAEEYSYTDWNVNPIGSGPYKIKSITRKSSGIPGIYTLLPFKNHLGGVSFVRRLSIHFYANEKELIRALKSGEIDQVNAINPKSARELVDAGYTVQTTTLPRVFGLYFNYNENKIFTNKKVIRAFDMAINKNAIIESVLAGFGQAIDSPIPPHLLEDNLLEGTTKTIVSSFNPDEARALLASDGWKPGADGVLTKGSGKTLERLSFSIATGDSPELRDAVTMIKDNLTAIGAEVEMKVFEIGTLNQNVIRPRKYDALFFGQVVNHESDLMAFWHSSQRNDPGLNIALYANQKTDKLLESALVTQDESLRNQKFIQFEEEIKRDLPAVFVYSPDFIYITKPEVDGRTLTALAQPQERFINSNEWYIEKDHVWRFFLPNTPAID